jgi:hypothetical protein
MIFQCIPSVVVPLLSGVDEMCVTRILTIDSDSACTHCDSECSVKRWGQGKDAGMEKGIAWRNLYGVTTPLKPVIVSMASLGSIVMRTHKDTLLLVSVADPMQKISVFYEVCAKPVYFPRKFPACKLTSILGFITVACLLRSIGHKQIVKCSRYYSKNQLRTIHTRTYQPCTITLVMGSQSKIATRVLARTTSRD